MTSRSLALFVLPLEPVLPPGLRHDGFERRPGEDSLGLSGLRLEDAGLRNQIDGDQ